MNRPDTTDIKTQLSGLVDKAVGAVQEQAGRLLDDKEMEARGALKVQEGDAMLHGAAAPDGAAKHAAPKATSPSTSKRARNGKTRRASRR